MSNTDGAFHQAVQRDKPEAAFTCYIGERKTKAKKGRVEVVKGEGKSLLKV